MFNKAFSFKMIYKQPSVLIPLSLTLKESTFTHGMVDMTHVARKPLFGISDQVQHKLDCTAAEDGFRLKLLDLESRGFVLSM